MCLCVCIVRSVNLEVSVTAPLSAVGSSRSHEMVEPTRQHKGPRNNTMSHISRIEPTTLENRRTFVLDNPASLWPPGSPIPQAIAVLSIFLSTPPHVEANLQRVCLAVVGREQAVEPKKRSGASQEAREVRVALLGTGMVRRDEKLLLTCCSLGLRRVRFRRALCEIN